MKTPIKYLSKELSEENILPSIYFNDSNDNIVKWVQGNIDKFNLNESYSCTVDWVYYNQIQISGDEDFLILDIITIKTKTL